MAAEPGQGLRLLASPSRAPPSPPPKKHGRRKGQGHHQDSESSESAFFLCPGGREKQGEVYKERKRTRKAQEILILTDRFSEFGRSYRAPLTPLQRQERAGPGPTSTHVSPLPPGMLQPKTSDLKSPFLSPNLLSCSLPVPQARNLAIDTFFLSQPTPNP